MESLWEALAGLIGIVIVFLTYFARQWVNAKVAPEKMHTVTQLARIVVQAAEQIGEHLEMDSSHKFNYAETALIEAARRLGVTVKPEEATAYIHAALADLKTFMAQREQEGMLADLLAELGQEPEPDSQTENVLNPVVMQGDVSSE